MTDHKADMPLGVGSIIGESFSILFRHFFTVLLMALVPTLLGTAVSVMMVGTGVAFGMEEPNFSSSGSIMNWALSLLLPIVFYGLATALLVQLAYDAKLGRPLQPGRYVAPALRAAIPIAVLMLIVGILTGIGFVLLVVPGLWLYAVFSLVAPAVVIEGAGFGGLGRSAALTKEYRWPIVGALILLGICTAIINFLATFIVGLLVGAGIGGGTVVMVVAFSILSALGAGLVGIAVALIYARLREIKEGVSVDQIASVFD